MTARPSCADDADLERLATRHAERAARRSWAATTARQYDAAAPDQPLTLFAAPDPCGTPDLFTERA